MAGEIEEHFSHSFRADLLHSGSISFGRFEHEDLSWERRSSFSHNRYLEEVEKYSKPGSVIEKKAYFEAHFKKKGMKLPGGFECPNQRENQSSDNDVFVSVEHEELDYDVKEGSNGARCDECMLNDVDHGEYDGNNERGNFDSLNYDNHHACYDTSPDGSEYQGQYEWTDHDREDPLFLSSESPEGTALDAAKVSIEGVIEDCKSERAHQTETICEKLPLESNKQETDVEVNLDHNVSDVDELSNSVNHSPKREAFENVDKASAIPQQKQSSKLKATEMKSPNSMLKSNVNANKVQQSSNVSKASGKNQKSKERASAIGKDLEKSLPKSSISTRKSQFKTPRKENSESCSSRTSVANKSEREPQLKKLVESPQTVSKKSEAKASHGTNRLNQHNGSTKPDTGSNATRFSFKSDERAERRKEFFMKLEEKMHAKEAKMNQIQAKTQEKAEAEIKQFRKSLNFKATPMPSFYRSTSSPDSDGKKAGPSKGRSSKEGEKLSSPGTKSAAKSQLLSKAGDDCHFTASEPVKTPKSPESSEFAESVGMESSDACQASSNGHPETVMRSLHLTGKDRVKVNVKSFLKHQVSNNSKTSKHQRVESKQKMRIPNEQRSMKGVGIGNDPPGMGNLAVGVAS